MAGFKTRLVVAAAAGAAAVALAAPASADPGDMPPCGLRFIVVCSMLPGFANLDHDVDLTQDPHALDGTPFAPAPDPATAPPG